MSLSTQTQKRLPKIKAGLLTGLNYMQIGSKCGVTEKTIDRDMQAFVESGEFETWIKLEWATLYAELHKNPEMKWGIFSQLTKLLGKMLTRKAEIKSEHTETQKLIHLHMWMPPKKSEGVELPTT